MRSYARELLAELESRSIAGRVERSGRHLRLVWIERGRERFYVFPGSPSDSMRGLRNALADLRRMLGGRIVLRSNGRVRQRMPRRAVEPPERLTVGRDWQAALEALRR